ncbi:hairy/enhancer-of-split related with YRPW motif protein 2-like isoform X1 [Lytechinus variegatus]|uniref:hairy/enhancer-of-split related with YRPW motif protein 2-like isoform X1 n=2 Tax=Lytechinus variegatus TaxID=7654 RepID=UPI001BB20B19|nr:hairy/enhancer-of-split related with YRPW motif protein 2-like isoform X1 [Lytechinus variegatus]
MATYERHLSSRRLRNAFSSTSNHGNVTKEIQTKCEPRRTLGRNNRKAKSLRAHHHHQTATPIGADTSQPGKMERIDRSLKELAQLLGLQTVGVDEASLLETTVSFFRSFSSSTSTTPDTHRRGGRHTDVSHAEEVSSHESDQTQDVSPTDAILAGFQDCMEETIRYLVDVEGFSPEDEVVVGLTAHLLQIRAKLDINNDATASTPWSSGRSSDGPTECEATTSTQTSPQETNTPSLALSTESINPPSLPTTSRTLLGGSVTRGLPPAHLMTPLTVDTNQYYALPSPLNRTALACAMKPSEPLLTVASTRPTHTVPALTSAAISSVSGHPLTATAPSAYSRHTAVTSQQQPPVQPPPQYQSVVSANGCLIPCVQASTSNQRPYGFNLNYVAPYVVAWVRPVQE